MSNSKSHPHKNREVSNPLLILLELNRKAREAKSTDELSFLLVNSTHLLSPYRQACIWWSESGVTTLSGVLNTEQNAPYVQWVNQLLKTFTPWPNQPTPLISEALSDKEISLEWSTWFPAHALVLPLPGLPQGALILARDHPWSEAELALLTEWTHTWRVVWQSMQKPSLQTLWKTLLKSWKPNPNRPWYSQKWVWALASLACILLFPVRLSVLAPGEVVPANPVVIRAPIEGVISKFWVQPNTTVEKGQLLFEFDKDLLQSRTLVARQTLETALAQFQQTSQLALTDPKYKLDLAAQSGAVEEKRAEYDYLRGQLQRTQIKAPAAGVVLFDDPSSWIGKPVAVGERILRVAKDDEVEVEAWLNLADAIDIPNDSTVTLYLLANPLQPIKAQVHYFSHEAVLRADGTYAYRIRARLDQHIETRVGLKGTAKINGKWTVLSYWLLRRPLAVLRTSLGV